MEIPFSRRDVGYSIISRFEEAFRSYLQKKLHTFFKDYQEGIPPEIIKKAKDKSGKETWEGASDFLEDTDFPHLKEIVCYTKKLFTKYFPGIDLKKNEFQSFMDELYILRCKIAHIRRYFTSLDLDKLLELTQKIARNLEADGKEFLNVIKVLKEHPEKIVIPVPIDFYCEESELIGVPNNLPMPDYEYEGGFVGREDDIKQIIKLLKARQVVTISGAGGVGKTALALKTIQELLIREEKNFDGIVWMSAKETRLSHLGIEDIEPTIKNYEQLLDTIAEVMGLGEIRQPTEEKEEDINTIFELFNCILVVIDNLETITDDRIISFILDANPNIKILITSRRGLGQVERRHELKQLKEKEAIFLFRQVARDKNLNGLAKLEDKVLKRYVNKVTCYPLAIKWIIGQVAIGNDINKVVDSIIETTSDISLFCFEQIYTGLSDDAKKILCALSVFDAPPSAGVLKYVVDLSRDKFEDGIQELILVSLIIPEQIKNEQNEIIGQYSLLSLTRGYVRHQLDRETVLKREIEERLRTVQSRIEEADRAKKQYRFSLSNLGATSDEEKVAAMLAQTALHKYQAGGYLDAIEDYKRACEIAPRFPALYRNWAVMESQEGHFIESDELMEKATKLNSDDPQIWLTWGTIKRKNNRIKEAEKYYQKAYELSPEDHIILNCLGQAKCRLGEYSEADKLFRRALQKESPGSSIRHEIINRSSLADNLKRWAESLIYDRNFKEAEKKLLEALENSEKVINLDKNDWKSQDLLRQILINLAFFYKKRWEFELAIPLFKRAIIRNPWTKNQKKDKIMASQNLIEIFIKQNNFDAAKIYLTSDLLRLIINPEQRERFDYYRYLTEGKQKTQNGRIIRMNADREFTIIESLSSPDKTFLGHIADFVEDIGEDITDLQGKTVSFLPFEFRKGREIKLQALNIKLL